MRIKITALVLSAMLPLSVWAAPEQAATERAMAQQEKGAAWSPEKMQQRQAAWFDRLELTAEQRELFQTEMQEHRALQQKARTAHHDKLRGLLTDEQRVKFDQDKQDMQKRMKKRMHKYSDKQGKGQNKGEGRAKMRAE